MAKSDCEISFFIFSNTIKIKKINIFFSLNSQPARLSLLPSLLSLSPAPHDLACQLSVAACVLDACFSPSSGETALLLFLSLWFQGPPQFPSQLGFWLMMKGVPCFPEIKHQGLSLMARALIPRLLGAGLPGQAIRNLAVRSHLLCSCILLFSQSPVSCYLPF